MLPRSRISNTCVDVAVTRVLTGKVSAFARIEVFLVNICPLTELVSVRNVFALVSALARITLCLVNVLAVHVVSNILAASLVPDYLLFLLHCVFD